MKFFGLCGVLLAAGLATGGAEAQEAAVKELIPTLASRPRTLEPVKENNGIDTYYIEFGGGRIGKVEVDFYSGPKPIGTYYETSVPLRIDKENSAPRAAHAGSGYRGATALRIGD